MKIIIRETNEIKHLSLICPKSGVDVIKNFLENECVLQEGGSLVFDEKENAYLCSDGVFNWWQWKARDYQALLCGAYSLVLRYRPQDVRAALKALASDAP